MEECNVLKLKGDDYERGRQYGQAMGEQIRRIVELNVASILDLAKRRGAEDVTPEKLREFARLCVPIARDYLPTLVDETQGLADGAGLSFDDVFGLNAFLDVFDFTYPGAGPDFFAGGCTCFGFHDLASNASYIGQNYDLRELFLPGATVLDITPERGPRALVVTIAGILGCAGINEAGIAVVINNLTPRDACPGVPHNYVVRHILAQERIGDAVNAIASLPRASGYSYILGDGDGNLIGLETSATQYSVFLPEKDGFIWHTNHYITETLAGMEGSPAFNGDSIARYARARSLLQRLISQPGSGIARLQEIAKDHSNYPYSICRHTDPSAGVNLEFQGRTIFSLIFDLRAKEFYLCLGNPCQGNYRKLTF